MVGNPVDGVKRPAANGNEGSTPALGEEQARKLLAAPADDTVKGIRDRTILATLLSSTTNSSERLMGRSWRRACIPRELPLNYGISLGCTRSSSSPLAYWLASLAPSSFIRPGSRDEAVLAAAPKRITKRLRNTRTAANRAWAVN